MEACNFFFKSQESNFALVLRLFTSAIFRSKVLMADQSRQLVTFMMEHAQELGEVPEEVMIAVNQRISEQKTECRELPPGTLEISPCRNFYFAFKLCELLSFTYRWYQPSHFSIILFHLERVGVKLQICLCTFLTILNTSSNKQLGQMQLALLYNYSNGTDRRDNNSFLSLRVNISACMFNTIYLAQIVVEKRCEMFNLFYI